MSRHHPVSPFERASFHRRGSAGWDLSGIQAVAPVAQVNLQPLVAQPISLAPSPVLGEDVYVSPAKRFLLQTGYHALWTPRGDGANLHRVWVGDGRTGEPDFVGYTDVEGIATPVFHFSSGMLWIIDDGTRVFGIDPKTRFRERP